MSTETILGKKYTVVKSRRGNSLFERIDPQTKKRIRVCRGGVQLFQTETSHYPVKTPLRNIVVGEIVESDFHLASKEEQVRQVNRALSMLIPLITADIPPKIKN